jgi:hypothetical protein
MFIDPIVKTIKGVSKLAKGVGRAVKEVYNISKAVIGEVYDIGKNVITTAGSFLKDSVIKPLGTLIGESFTMAIKGGVKAVEYFGRTLDTVVDGVFKGLNILKDAFFEAGKTVMSFVKAGGSLLRSGLGMLSSGVSKVIGRDKRKSLGSVYVEGGHLDSVKEVIKVKDLQIRPSEKLMNNTGQNTPNNPLLPAGNVVDIGTSANQDTWQDKRKQARANEELETEKNENKLLGNINEGISKLNGENGEEGLFSKIGSSLSAALIGDVGGEFTGTLIGDTAGEVGGGILGALITNAGITGVGASLLYSSGIGSGLMGILDFFKGIGKADEWFDEGGIANKVFSGTGAFFSGSDEGTSNVVKNAIKWGLAGGAIA